MALERVRILRWLEGNYSFKKMFSLHTAILCERQKTCWHPPFKIRKLNASEPFLFCTITVLWVGLKVNVYNIHLDLFA